jgi:FMN phosphatase YigB (HAD superfamily)
VLNRSDVVFLLDVDDTLLDNDRFIADLGEHLAQLFGVDERDRYWSIHTQLRAELGFVDYLGALNRFREGLDDDPALLQMSSFILDYPFDDLLYPRALESIAHLRLVGLPVVLSDGDVVLQPRKIRRSGIWESVDGRVLVYPHKERSLNSVQRRHPARHYVMVDDKAMLLAAMKRVLGGKLTTVFVRQGHYARELDDPAVAARVEPAPDRVIDRIADLLDHDPSQFIAATHAVAATSQERT